MTRIAFAAVVAVGCYSPAYQDCAVSCATTGVCPSGLDCVAGLCRTMTGACGGDDASIDGPPLVGKWQFRKKLTVPGGPDAPVDSFPLLVRRSMDQDLANFAQDDGGDLRFTTIDGTFLAYELERFDKATGDLVAWVRVPRLIATTELFLYYGNPESQNLESPSAVWDASFVGVWHLADPAGVTISDSTVNALTGTKAMPNAPAPIFGTIDLGLLYGGGVGELVSFGASAALQSTEYTIEMWVNRSVTATNTYPRLIDFPEAFTVSPRISYPDDGAGTVNKRSIVIEPSVDSGTQLQTATGSVPADQWVHIVVRTDGSAANTSVYIDGAVSPTTVAPFGLTQSNTELTVGGKQDAVAPSIVGRLDEVRISRVLRSPDYIQATYLNAAETGYVLFGAAETLP